MKWLKAIGFPDNQAENQGMIQEFYASFGFHAYILKKLWKKAVNLISEDKFREVSPGSATIKAQIFFFSFVTKASAF